LATGFLNPWILININRVLQRVRRWVFSVRVLRRKRVFKTAPLQQQRLGRAVENSFLYYALWSRQTHTHVLDLQAL